MNKADKILKQYKNITLIQYLEQILDWDSEVNLPSGGYEYRAEQAAWLASVVHQKLTEPEFVNDVLSFIPDNNGLQKDEIAFIKRVVELEQKIPEKLIIITLCCTTM